MHKNKHNRNFVVTLAVLPAMVQLVIMLVNGNIGAGVAVAGAFSLVRFRSIPGTARDIGSIFFSMAIGLASGMGYIGLAVLFTLIVGLATLLLINFNFGGGRQNRILKILIPESLDYDGLFDDIFDEHLESYEVDRIRTTNMGSLFELTYLVTLKKSSVSKAFIDAIRTRNGNLTVSISREHAAMEEL
jgi:uncharacterized membrane protein YhiD involved in acid resistance